MAMSVCITGATGFVGAHLARLACERGDRVRVTYRDDGRLARLEGLEVEPVQADVLDRAAMRRAVRGAEVLFHSAGIVASRPVQRVWELNALAPRVAVEAAAAEGVRRVVVTSSVAAIGPPPPGGLGRETDVYRAGPLRLTYVDAKHEGEVEALAAGARLGVEVVAVNPAYVLGAPVDRSQPPETSARVVANYLRGRLPAVVDGGANIVDVEDVAAGHLLAAERGRPGERYILGAHNLAWSELIDRVARLSGVHHPLVVLPTEVAALARVQQRLGIPGLVSPEAYTLMAQNWRYSSARARRELGWRSRPLDRTLRATVEWCRELIDSGALAARPSSLSLAAAGLRAGGRLGLVRGLRAVEGRLGRRLVAGA